MPMIEDIKRRLSDAPITKVFFVDLNGRVMSLPINPEKIERFLEAERSRFLPEPLGDHAYRSYMTLKTTDWEEHRTHVTPREHARYL